MSNRQKIYIGVAVSVGVCSGIALFLYFRHRRQFALSKTPDDKKHTSIISTFKSRRGDQYTDITSTLNEIDTADSESVRFESGGATVQIDLPSGTNALTPDQAIVLTNFLNENFDDIERLHRILTSIANSASFTESQVHLANAGCINKLREILSKTNNETTQCKILLALNNLALNEHTITHFSGLVPVIINLCRTTPAESLVRLYGLNLLLNMSVLEYLHDEYMNNLLDIGVLIESTFDHPDEALSAGKILVNLSTNKSNLKHLLKLTGFELKTIVKKFTPPKKMTDEDEISKLDDILLRYLNFYCNLSEIVVAELKQTNENPHHHNLWSNDPIRYPPGAIYSELFDNDKHMLIKSILRPQYSSNLINIHIKRLRQAMDTIRQIEFELSVSSAHDEFNDNDQLNSTPDASTPKKTNPITEDNPLADLDREVNDEFENDDTILADQSTPSNQSLSSYRSAYSTNENNTFTSPEKSITT